MTPETGVVGQTILVHSHEWVIWSQAPGSGCFHAFRRTDDGTKWIVVKRKPNKGGRDEWKEV